MQIAFHAGIGVERILLVDAPVFERVVLVEPGAVYVANPNVDLRNYRIFAPWLKFHEDLVVQLRGPEEILTGRRAVVVGAME